MHRHEHQEPRFDIIGECYQCTILRLEARLSGIEKLCDTKCLSFLTRAERAEAGWDAALAVCISLEMKINKLQGEKGD